MLLSYTSIIITQNNLIHRFHKMVTTYNLQHITNNVDTRDPIGSKNVLHRSFKLLYSGFWVVSMYVNLCSYIQILAGVL